MFTISWNEHLLPLFMLQPHMTSHDDEDLNIDYNTICSASFVFNNDMLFTQSPLIIQLRKSCKVVSYSNLNHVYIQRIVLYLMVYKLGPDAMYFFWYLCQLDNLIRTLKSHS